MKTIGKLVAPTSWNWNRGLDVTQFSYSKKVSTSWARHRYASVALIEWNGWWSKNWNSFMPWARRMP
jgi:hypothetical protein